MLVYVLMRLLFSVIVLIVASIFIFWLSNLALDPLSNLRAKHPAPTHAMIAQQEHRLYLDRPIIERYFLWIRGILHGDFGPSAQSGYDIGQHLGSAFKVTINLLWVSILLSILLSIIIGVMGAVKHGTWIDKFFNNSNFILYAVPVFYLALLIKIFAININVFFQNVTGSDITLFAVTGDSTPGITGNIFTTLPDTISHMILPTIVLTIVNVTVWSRYERASMLDILGSDFIRCVRSRGLSKFTIIRHALRSSLITFITVVTLELASLLSGAIITETVFSWNGMGSFFVNSLHNSDIYAISSWLLLTSAIIILFNFIADLMYSKIDPRIGRG